MSLFSMFLLLRRYGPAGEASPVCKEIDEDSVDDDQENGARAREVRDNFADKHTS